MENLVFFCIALCGFASGYSARINPHGVPQREPNPFWGVIAGIVFITTLLGGIEMPIGLFVIQSMIIFGITAAIGIAITWSSRKRSSLISD